MSNGTDEIREIRQRLEAIERAINELHKLVKDLTDSVKWQPAKEATEQAQGEPVKEVTEYVEGEKVDTADKAIEKVDNAEEAMDIAHTFMKKDSSVALPLKAVRQDDVWLVDVDIGAVRVEIVRIKLDAKTGNILGQETVERK